MHLKNIQRVFFPGLWLVLGPVFGQATISGIVLDSASQPGAVIIVPWAEVALQTPGPDTGFTTVAVDTTDFDGLFSFSDVPDGSYSLLTTAYLYRPDRTPVTVSGQASREVEIRLTAIPVGTLMGMVKVEGVGVFSARLDLEKDGKMVASQTTTSNGMYFFYDLLEIGLTYELTASYAGCVPQTVIHTQSASEDEVNFDLELDTGQTGAAPPPPDAGTGLSVRTAGPGLLRLDRLDGAGILALHGLDGRRLWQVRVDGNTALVAVPAQVRLHGNVFIARLRHEGGACHQKLALPR